jgi:hypothetical protein
MIAVPDAVTKWAQSTGTHRIIFQQRELDVCDLRGVGPAVLRLAVYTSGDDLRYSTNVDPNHFSKAVPEDAFVLVSSISNTHSK